jgi:hypothetical protein
MAETCAQESQKLSAAEKAILWFLAVGGQVVGVCTFLLPVWPLPIFPLPYNYYLYVLLFAVLSLGVVSAFRLARLRSYSFAAWILFGLNALIIMDWFVTLLVGLLKKWIRIL